MMAITAVIAYSVYLAIVLGRAVDTIYLAFVLSAVLSSIAKIVADRRGFQPW